jgi:hypothetical protein
MRSSSASFRALRWAWTAARARTWSAPVLRRPRLSQAPDTGRRLTRAAFRVAHPASRAGPAGTPGSPPRHRPAHGPPVGIHQGPWRAARYAEVRRARNGAARGSCHLGTLPASDVPISIAAKSPARLECGRPPPVARCHKCLCCNVLATVRPDRGRHPIDHPGVRLILGGARPTESAPACGPEPMHGTRARENVAARGVSARSPFQPCCHAHLSDHAIRSLS